MVERLSPLRTTCSLPLAALTLLRGVAAEEGRPGMARRVPAATMLGLAIRFSWMRRSVLVPKRSAISERVSPLLMVYGAVGRGRGAAALALLRAPGSTSFWPSATTLGLLMPLACISRVRLTPWRSAISESVSPCCTVTRPVEPPAPCAPALLRAPGSTSFWPAATTLGLLMPLACISRVRLTPWRSAISERVSPGFTTTSARAADGARPGRGNTTARARAARERRMDTTHSYRNVKGLVLSHPAPEAPPAHQRF